MVKLVSCALLAVCALFACGEAAKIVAFPYPGGASHVFIMAKIGVELTTRGHEFVLVVADMDEHHAKARTAGTAVKVLPFNAGYDKAAMDELTRNCTKQDPITCSVTITKMCVGGCRELLLNEAAVDQIKDADLAIGDISYPCGYTFADLYNVPFRAALSPVGFYDPWGAMHWGIPSNPSYVPQLGSKFSNKMDFAQRLENTIVQGVLYYVTPILDKLADDLRQEFNITPDHTTSARSAGTYIVNADWATEFPRPITPVTHVVGPILPEPAKALPAELEQWMAQAENGVLIVSLGTLVEAVLTAETVNTLSEVFASLPVKVLWKLSIAPPTTVGANTHIEKWIPQNDLLGHAKTKAFLTHGGMNSVQEAAYHGVPMLGFPHFADQFDNIIRMVAAGTCVEVHAEKFTAGDLTAKINELLSNPIYEQNAEKVSKRMHDRLRTPTQEAADWIEFALRNDNGQYLRVPTLDMPWIQAGNFDVYAVFATIVLLLVWAVYALIKRLLGVWIARALFVAVVAFVALK
eukprot:m.224363 g.224363  ORF g.224363 m.224363 type:complete len:521 (-) comp11085_c0_seq1:48-1610(-)